ncbi:hypothetical protein [Streptosporangium sp. NPDC000396]|uniref:hypothetical protein n=1 Tax=Streptosporangium sp. NPDC000396 TaxID=3366185 RepID=UPI0036997125
MNRTMIAAALIAFGAVLAAPVAAGTAHADPLGGLLGGGYDDYYGDIISDGSGIGHGVGIGGLIGIGGIGLNILG